MRPLLLCLLVVLALAPFRPAEAAEPFFKKGDVIALVGGEDMVVASEYGYLELLLTRALPDYHLRFRNLAWEGDTVFEQRRDLNFPSYEEQLDKIGATVVIAQFGQMESLAAAQEPRRRGGAEGEKAAVAEFIAAYEKLIERFSAGGKRRVVLINPNGFEPTVATPARLLGAETTAYQDAVEGIAKRTGSRFVSFYWLNVLFGNLPCASPDEPPRQKPRATRDTTHLTQDSHFFLAQSVCEDAVGVPIAEAEKPKSAQKHETLRQLIIAKNRLWFDYWRPQNWAFLAGDRTAQPSSRDHLDPSKRWFPPEREAFLPLLEAKEKEIDALAADLVRNGQK